MKENLSFLLKTTVNSRPKRRQLNEDSGGKIKAGILDKETKLKEYWFPMSLDSSGDLSQGNNCLVGGKMSLLPVKEKMGPYECENTGKFPFLSSFYDLFSFLGLPGGWPLLWSCTINMIIGNASKIQREKKSISPVSTEETIDSWSLTCVKEFFFPFPFCFLLRQLQPCKTAWQHKTLPLCRRCTLLATRTKEGSL